MHVPRYVCITIVYWSLLLFICIHVYINKLCQLYTCKYYCTDNNYNNMYIIWDWTGMYNCVPILYVPGHSWTGTYLILHKCLRWTQIVTPGELYYLSEIDETNECCLLCGPSVHSQHFHCTKTAASQDTVVHHTDTTQLNKK